jgi:putative oxidoreductase
MDFVQRKVGFTDELRHYQSKAEGGRIMSDTPSHHQRYYVPFVAPLYEAFTPYVYTLVRVSLGAILIPHGYDKLFLNGAVGAARNTILNIFGDPLTGAYFIGGVEFFGGLMLVLGLFTRIAAAAIFIQMFVISFFVLWPVWGWTQRGMEFAVLMALLSLAIFIRGGGRHSIDAMMAKEF